VREHAERFDLADPRTCGPGVRDPGLIHRQNVCKPIADHGVVGLGDQHQRVGLGQQLFVERSPDAPGFVVADVRREFRHGLGMPVMDRHPQRPHKIQVRDAADPQAPFCGHHATLVLR
jgi:hypothetical protein